MKCFSDINLRIGHVIGGNFNIHIRACSGDFIVTNRATGNIMVMLQYVRMHTIVSRHKNLTCLIMVYPGIKTCPIYQVLPVRSKTGHVLITYSLAAAYDLTRWHNNILYTPAFWARLSENLSYAKCEQQRRRSDCASAQSDQRLCCSLL